MDDFSCALFGPDGQLVAQWWDHPGHVLPLPWGVRCAFDDFKDDIHPGDVLLLNDPYRGGTHLNDVTVIFPVFNDTGQLMIFPAVRAHWVDVGGMVPGSYSGLSTNIYQEGVRIPPIKIWERGVPNRAAMTLLMANMRIPVERQGDLNASIGSCRIAEERDPQARATIRRKTWSRTALRIAPRSDRAALARAHRRASRRRLPLRGLSRVLQRRPLRSRARAPALTSAGDQITADFTGSNAQVPGVVNNSLAVAGAGVFVAIKSTLDPGGAVNEGAFRPDHAEGALGHDLQRGARCPGRRPWRGAQARGLRRSRRARADHSGEGIGRSLRQLVSQRHRRLEPAPQSPVRLLRGAGGRQWRALGCRRRERVRQRRFRQPAVDPQCGIDRERDAAHGRELRVADRRRRRQASSAAASAWCAECVCSRRRRDTPC